MLLEQVLELPREAGDGRCAVVGGCGGVVLTARSSRITWGSRCRARSAARPRRGCRRRWLAGSRRRTSSGGAGSAPSPGRHRPSWRACGPAGFVMSGWYPAGSGPNPSEAEDLVQLHGHRHLELLVGARRRLAVGAPALEPGGVAEAVALQVLVGDLGDETRCATAPSSGPCPRSTGSARRVAAGPTPSASAPSGLRPSSRHGWSSSAPSR